MKNLVFNNKEYKVDVMGFLLNPYDWDENFAEGVSAMLEIPDGLTEDHWKIIHYIRTTYENTKSCPLIYDICKDNNLTLKEFKCLFPTGNQRGACKIAGISFRKEYIKPYFFMEDIKEHELYDDSKTYRIDGYGFLVQSDEWDEVFAINKSIELKMPERLTEKHWKIIYYLREKFDKTNNIPTIFDTCEDNNIELDELEKLFPDGYHRGAVKIAGLRLK